MIKIIYFSRIDFCLCHQMPFELKTPERFPVDGLEIGDAIE
jgi:hypothetical protein